MFYSNEAAKYLAKFVHFQASTNWTMGKRNGQLYSAYDMSYYVIFNSSACCGSIV